MYQFVTPLRIAWDFRRENDPDRDFDDDFEEGE